MPATIFHGDAHPRRGERCSTAAAYLEPALADQSKHPHLAVLTHAHARRIVWASAEAAEGAPLRAAGVEYVWQGKEMRVARASKEVVLCAGAIESPHLLQLSGVGHPAQLEACGIPLLHALPGVGRNLQDHLELYQSYECLAPVSLSPHLGLLRKALLGARWLLFKDGLGATNHFEAGGFVRSRAGVARPDVQLHFVPVAISYDGKNAAPSSTGHSFQVHVGYNRSPSRGTVTPTAPLAPSAATAHAPPPPPPPRPRVRFNYMSEEEDWRGFRAAVRIAREIVRQPAFDDLVGAEIQPGDSVASDAQLDAYLADHLESAYHPCGTCRMGAFDQPGAVVDGTGRVHGVRALRVVDASVFPTITNGNLNAPTIMVAEKLADAILGRALPPDEPAAAAVWADPHWHSRQRENAPQRRVWDGVF